MAEPPPLIAPWQWAEQKRFLPLSSAEPGRMMSKRAPWTRAITEAIIDPRYKEVIAVQGSQTSKTDGVLLNTLGWQMDYRRKPALFYAPTEDNANAISDRMKNMFLGVESIAAALDRKRLSKHEFFIYGVRCGIGWAGSESQVASHPAELVVFDELDRISDLVRDGNPWQLTKVRNSTYPSGTQVGTSSPTIGLIEDERHPITGLIHWKIASEEHLNSLAWELWQEGTRGEFMLPCPDCGSYFAPKAKLLYIPEDADANQASDAVRMICPHCGVLIHHKHQNEMIDKGLMICPGQSVKEGKVVGNKPTTLVASFHVNGLCSRWVSWSKRAYELVRVKKTKNTGRIQAVYNTEFGECYWVEPFRSNKWNSLHKLCSARYELGEIPPEVKILTTGVDVQHDRLVVVTYGWSANQGKLDTYLVEYEELFGNTGEPEVWEMLRQKYVDKPFTKEMFISEIGIDTGFNPSQTVANKGKSVSRNIVYHFCRVTPRCVAIKGSSRPMAKPYHSNLVDEDNRGRVRTYGLRLWQLDTGFFKHEIFAKLSRTQQRERHSGIWHFAQNTPDKFFKELTAEEYGKDGKWTATGENHVLDATVICFFLAEKLQIKQLAATVAVAPAVQTQVTPSQSFENPYRGEYSDWNS